MLHFAPAPDRSVPSVQQAGKCASTFVVQITVHRHFRKQYVACEPGSFWRKPEFLRAVIRIETALTPS
jgi:hypothetical protein